MVPAIPPPLPLQVLNWPAIPGFYRGWRVYFKDGQMILRREQVSHHAERAFVVADHELKE